MLAMHLARFIVAVAVASGVGAIFRYPGGTFRDHGTKGYSFAQNFLSDLGMTVAYNGEANRLGAALFILSLLLLVIGLGSCLVAVVRLYARTPKSRHLARIIVVGGVLACVMFVGVAMTPENAAMHAHVAFTLWAWRIVACVALLLWAAAIRSNVHPRRAAVTSGIVAAMTIGYVALLSLGPTTATSTGLVVQVTAQKAIAVVVVTFLLY